MTNDTSLQKFLAEAANHRLLTAHEEKALGRRSQAGDHTARNELVLCNIRLVVSIARYYRNRGLAMEDVIQEGIIGLNRAAEKFDPERGTRFTTYATLWIRQAIQRGLQNTGIAIRLPYAVSSIRGKVRSAQAEYAELRDAHRTAHLSDPDASVRQIAKTLNLDADKLALALGHTEDEFVARALDIEIERVQEILDTSEVVTSIDREVSSAEEHTATLLDSRPWADEWGNPIDPYDDAALDDDLSDELRAAIKELDRRQRRVLEMHFGLTGNPPMTMKEIAAKLGAKSENTVKSLRTKALASLAEHLQHRA